MKFNIYKAKDGWRWNIKRAGRIVADSGEAYTRRYDCRKALASVISGVTRKFPYPATTRYIMLELA